MSISPPPPGLCCTCQKSYSQPSGWSIGLDEPYGRQQPVGQLPTANEPNAGVQLGGLGGGVPIVQLVVAGLGSTLPDGSTARTANVCVPVGSDKYVVGEKQPDHVPPSSWHWKTEPASVEANVNEAPVEVVDDPEAGPPVIVVSGGVVS